MLPFYFITPKQIMFVNPDAPEDERIWSAGIGFKDFLLSGLVAVKYLIYLKFAPELKKKVVFMPFMNMLLGLI